jgi:lantibiotic modifying enzyme
VSFSENEFIAILEAAADFADYRSGQYFIKRDSKTASRGSAVRLRDPSKLPPWATDLRRLFTALAEFDFNSKRSSPLVRLCEAGARFGWQELESTLASEFLALLSLKAKRCLKRDLERILQRATRPSLELERKSYNLALAAIGFQAKGTDPQLWDAKFVGKKPSERLFAIFGRFPVLSRLWLQLIFQWRDHVTELLSRLVADRTALSRAFLGGQPAGPIIDMRCGLSDPHNHGRTVMLLRFASSSVIYKPRPGDGEWEWFSFLQAMNAQSFRPRLRAARVLRRKDYCWMECMESFSCRDEGAARRFYRRMGGILCAAYLLKTVDCHRENVIAAGEDPILVDAEALWHGHLDSKARTPIELLCRTGFLPDSEPRSLRSRSSALGRGKGKHVPIICGQPLRAVHYEREIVAGFCRAWRCLLGTKKRRAALVWRLRRICSRKRRWIYRPTETYGALAQASVQPASLRSGIERDLLLSRLCSRRTVPAAVVHAEVDALKRLDIPYFVGRSKGSSPPDKGGAPAELIEGLRRALTSQVQVLSLLLND